MSSNGLPELEVPELKDFSYEGIETYISDLKRTKRYGRFNEDRDLIFCSLIKGKQTSLFNDMAKGDDEDIDKFSAFLKNMFGISPESLLEKFRTLKQDELENALRFYNRVVKLFYRIRDMDVPQKIEDKIHKLEMTQAFLQGLRNREVSKILARNRKQIDFENLGTFALDYEIVENQKWE